MNDLNSNKELEGGEKTKNNGIPKEKTFSCESAIPKDIKTKKIAEYPIKKVAFSKYFGEGIS